MTRLLASIASIGELPAVLAGGADLVDVKDPAVGALGAADDREVRAIVAAVAGRRPVSATLGDLPMDPKLLCESTAKRAALGVDIVKVGLFPEGDLPGCLGALARPAERIRMVGVLFADRAPDFELLAAMADAGFAGAMLDTADKSAGSLTRHLPLKALEGFVTRARALGLMTGLAGSLSLADIGPLAALGPDYLGFRGALCAGGRSEAIDPASVRAIRQALDTASSATAAAGAAIAASSRSAGSPSRSSAKSR